jgi:tetratricopeptide (TPR) repeat protein
MGRPETPLDPGGGPLQEFAARLRSLRADSGGRSYRQLARVANFAAPTLARAASGRSFPSWEVTQAYVTACGADPGQWRALWASTARRVGADAQGGGQPAGDAGLAVRQLPADVQDFTGRTAECAGIRRLVNSPARTAATGGAPTVIMVWGPGGIGKTTLAVHAAYQVADRYPDGQLFADLRGHDDRPATAAQVAVRFLAALAIGVDRRADPVCAFRSAVSGRRLLIVLDNAADEEQVGPLLPGSTGSLVLVTSRQALGALPSTHSVRLDVLDHQSAVRMLSRIAGADRAGQTAAIASLAELCGRFPIALRIAGSRLATEPAAAVGLLVDRLRRDDTRLRHLMAGDHDLSAVFAASYRPLTKLQRRVFHMAGLFPGPDFPVAALVVLTDRDAADVECALLRLTDASLIEPAGTAPGRYRVHDLLRLYALERGEADGDAAERASAIRRLAAWYLGAVDAADRALMPARGRPAPSPDLPAQSPTALFADVSPAAWYDGEHASLVAVVREAARHGHHDIVWRLTVAMRGLLELRGHTEDWVRVHQMGWDSAAAIGDRHAEGWVLNGMGTGYWHSEAYAEAIDCYRKALAIRTELADDRGVAVVLNNLGCVYGVVGRNDEALDCLRGALVIRERLGDELDKSFALNSLGHLQHERGMFADALANLTEALRIRRHLGNRNGEAATLHCLGDTLAGLGRMAEALACLRQALTIFRELGNRYGEAVAVHSLGSACRAMGRPEHAKRYLRSAISRYEELGQRSGMAAAREELAAATEHGPHPHLVVSDRSS